jgi:hypothetical protein
MISTIKDYLADALPIIIILGIATAAVFGPAYFVSKERERENTRELKAWEKYKAENECKKIGTIYPNQVKYECAEGYIYTRVE